MSSKRRYFYNKISFFYPVINVFLKSNKRRLSYELNALPEGDLLDIGVGMGGHLKDFKKHNITGIDQSENMLAYAKRFQNDRITILNMDAEQLEFENQRFDYVVMAHLLSVVDDPDLVLKEAFRILKPKGKLLIVNHFTPKNFLKYFDKNFEFFASWFHFKSDFRLDDLSAPLEPFELIKSEDLGWFSYFKLLIYQKP
ncbi:MAG: class I SAM-dependent methyltransferase [Flavobacteriales bacterium]